MLIAAIAIVVTAVCSMFLFYQILEEQIFDDLKANAHVVSVISPDQLSKDITYSLETDGLRITCVDENGDVEYDSMEDVSSMENHKERPEIAEAMKNGGGKSIRVSSTSSKHTFYYALRKEDGSAVRGKRERKHLSSGVYDVGADLGGWTDGISDVCILFIPPDAETDGTDREDGRQYRSRG